MKNIHLISTDKPSRLHEFGGTWFSYKEPSKSFRNYKMYITNDEEIKEGDWFIYRCYKVCKCTGLSQSKQILTDNEIAKHKDYGKPQGLSKKIILTTDQDLDGVQSIDDEFLKWFVKNPSCEWVEVGYGWIRLAETDNEGYWVSIPDKQFEMQQEEPKQDLRKYPLTPDECFKQETLEEAAYNYENSFKESDGTESVDFIAGAKWQAERMYSEEDMRGMYDKSCGLIGLSLLNDQTENDSRFKKLFEQFKKK
jgi:hypothetical protein